MMQLGKALDYQGELTRSVQGIGRAGAELVRQVCRANPELPLSSVDQAQRLIASATLAALIVHDMKQARTRALARSKVTKAARHLKDAVNAGYGIAVPPSIALSWSSAINQAERSIEHATKVAT